MDVFRNTREPFLDFPALDVSGPALVGAANLTTQLGTPDIDHRI